MVSIGESYRPLPRDRSGRVASHFGVGHDPCVDDSIELSSLLASLEDIAKRISTIVEKNADIEGVDAELIALERSVTSSLRRLRRATRSAEKRR